MVSIRVRRQEKIMELVRARNIQTQDELCALLTDAGFSVTQATVSRDIKELGLIKVAVTGGYKYALSAAADLSPELERYRKVLLEVTVRVAAAGNLVIVNTLSGAASAAAAAVDAMKWTEIIGCIAGDDTVFLAVATPQVASEICARFRLLLKN
ncbi:MAG: arginine repressor [Clostridia bacterium]|nr:arginine repressor [Clostridia bacterium]